VEVKLATPEAFRASYLRDVSTGGIFVRSTKPLPIGTRVVVQLMVAERLAALPGAVVRVEDGVGFGVKFDLLDEEQQRAVSALVEQNQMKVPEVSVETKLAEAQGVIEAYEQTLASLREELSDANERADQASFERQVIGDHVRELQTKLDAQLKENTRLMNAMRASEDRLKALEREVTRRVTEDKKRQAELDAARSVIDQTSAEVSQLEADFARRMKERDQREEQLRKGLDAELKAVTAAIAKEPEIAKLRDEMRELSSQLDDERLKAMALQRALERFVAMGGTIPAAQASKS
jgi:chromosome segregation ATPase